VTDSSFRSTIWESRSYSTSVMSRRSRPSDQFILVRPSLLFTTTLFALPCSVTSLPRQTSSSSGKLTLLPLPDRFDPETDSASCTSYSTTIEGETNYYIREIKTTFVVGQTYPITEVPGPHSRKITTLMKNRLQAIAFKLIERSPKRSIKVHQLVKYFPDQNDLQMRQKLKVGSPSPSLLSSPVD
jgi:hypothetical protein